MTGNGPKPVDVSLDDLFEELRGEDHRPSDALMDRIILDAAQNQPQPAPALTPARGPSQRLSPQGGAFGRLSRLLGGWPALGSLATAACVGFWIGFAGLTGTVGQAAEADPAELQSLDLMPGTDDLFETYQG